MDESKIRQKQGKRCKIILKNNYEYTAIIPSFVGTSFKIIDKFGKEVDIECEFIALLEEK